jgi:hypothetical protein
MTEHAAVSVAGEPSSDKSWPRSGNRLVGASRHGTRSVELVPRDKTLAALRSRRAVLRRFHVWIEIHTPAVAWNLFHATNARGVPWLESGRSSFSRVD